MNKGVVQIYYTKDRFTSWELVPENVNLRRNVLVLKNSSDVQVEAIENYCQRYGIFLDTEYFEDLVFLTYDLFNVIDTKSFFRFINEELLKNINVDVIENVGTAGRIVMSNN